MNKLLTTILVLAALNNNVAFAQKKDKQLSKEKTVGNYLSEDDMLEDAEYYFYQGEYLSALPLYVELSKKHPKNVYYKFNSGICYLYKSDEKEQAIPI